MDEKKFVLQATSGQQADKVIRTMQMSQVFTSIKRDGCHITATYYGDVSQEELIGDLKTYKGWLLFNF